MKGIRIENLAVVNGADQVFGCLETRFLDIATSSHDVFRLRVETAAYTGRGRELFEKAAREGRN